ncbi:YIP1 family protein [Sulfitobacter albidus]|uniref:YIP1 family protein n=1 Tax=Sulfitobacter albidus TaxID=2829501 RepID=A0A975JFU2_9RHOB|nr:YIP1 family protein [Sulfitobacter albidus]QUJ77746.1 YIP1 family protein [Sulfitobacter albidus]
MISDELKDLALQTIQSPREAARRIMGTPLSRDALWSGLVLAAAINAILYSLSLFGVDTSVLPPLLSNPLMFFFLITGVLVITVHAFFWTGKMIGGQGDLGDLLKLMVWLQILRAGAQAIMLVLMLVAPFLAQLFSLVVGVLGLWITVNFLTEGLQLRSLMQGVGVLILSAVGIIFGLLVLVALIGTATLGVPANV